MMYIVLTFGVLGTVRTEGSNLLLQPEYFILHCTFPSGLVAFAALGLCGV